MKALEGRLVIGVTGTKGKSSTSALIAHVIGRLDRCVLAGNCGVSPLDVLDQANSAGWTVLELANFQTIDLSVAPRYGVVRGVTTDHLDWHLSREEYVESKMQLFRAQTRDSVAVHDGLDSTSASVARASAGSVVAAPSEAIYVDAQRDLVVNHDRVARLSPSIFPGGHGIGNALAAAHVLAAIGVDAESIGAGITSFAGLPHRLEALPSSREIRFVNDSHSTAVQSTIAALRTVRGPLVLLVGGDGKSADFRLLAQTVVAADVRACVTFGVDGPAIANALRSVNARVIEVETTDMRKVVAAAVRVARVGDCVLLSPGCASTDAFQHAVARGEAFVRAVEEVCG